MNAVPHPTIALLQTSSLTSVVQQEIERAILRGEYAPGAKLVEANVAEKLGVSRGPVREAFRSLEEAGLVRTEKNRGVFVREVSLAEADEIYEVRAGLDELIGRLAAERAEPRDVRELRALLRDMKRAARSRSVDEYYPLNVRFHERIAQITGNTTLLATYRRLVNELHLYRRETLARNSASFPASTREHAAIVDALEAGDGDRASQLLYRHAMESRTRLHQTLAARAAVAAE